MKDLLQDHCFTFRIGPAFFSGWKALSHLPFELSRRGVTQPVILRRKDPEGESLRKAVSESLSEGGFTDTSCSSMDESLPEHDGIIALGRGSIQDWAKGEAFSVPLFTVLSDLQDCFEAGTGRSGRFPDAVFLDPDSYQDCVTKHTAESALTALGVFTEALQEDKGNSFLYSMIRTGLMTLREGAPWDGNKASRQCCAEASAAAALVRSNMSPGGLTSAGEVIHASGFATRSEASGALIPVLLQQMKRKGSTSLELLDRETGNGAAYILDILETLREPSEFSGKTDSLLRLAEAASLLAQQQHAPRVLELLSEPSRGGQA